MLVITEQKRQTDPRPPIGSRMVIHHDGGLSTATVQHYPRGDGGRTWPVREDLPPYQWHVVWLSDPRIVEPAEYKTQSPR